MVAPSREDLNRLPDERVRERLQSWVGKQAFEIDHFDRSELGVVVKAVDFTAGSFRFSTQVNQEADYFPIKIGESCKIGSSIRPTFQDLGEGSLLVTFFGNIRLRLTRAEPFAEAT